jgi:drug/metabolite transporter (DMT)-like permease
MTYLILGILFNVAIFIAFRTFAAMGIRTLPAIVVNYYVCVLTGLVFLGNLQGIPAMLSPDNQWLYFALALGLLFILTFYMMAVSTQRLSVTVSSIAAKMSLAIPVIFSLFVFQIEAKAFDLLNYLGILIAFLAIYLSSLRKKEKIKKGEQVVKNRALFLLPIAIFICGGIIDTTINYTAFTYLTDAEAAVFPLVIFLVAGILGTALQLATRQSTGLKELLGGIGLGIPNYFSIYFIVKALAAFDNNGAFVYPILNISIILFSSLFAIVFFKEQLLRANKIGLGLAVLAIFLISYQEIIAYFT